MSRVLHLGRDATTEALMRRLEEAAESLDAVVIGVDADEPVRLAQRAQAIDRDLGVLIVTEAPDHARLSGALAFVPFLSSVVRCVPADPAAALTAAIDDAAAQTARRRGFRATVGRAREQFGAAPPPPLAEATYLQHVLEHVPIAILAADANGRIEASNRAAQVLLGGSERELLGRYVGTGLPAPERAQLLVAISGALEGQASRAPVPLTLVTGGRTRLVEADVSALPRRDHPRVMLMLRDVTGERELQAQLRAADRLASVGLLAAGVAHEVNNPLTAVLVNVDRAVKAIEPAAAAGSELALGLRAPMRDALEASDRIQNIVRDLMLLARGDDEALSPVDVEPVMQSTLRMAGGQIRDRARLIESYARVPFVKGNTARLGQVFLNVVLNAAQAIPPGGASRAELRVTTSADETHVHVDVEDTGPGMAPDVLDRLFTPFFTTKPPGEGTGLGLSICHRIVTAMGGTIAIDSAVGRGTRVRVSLLRAVAVAQPIGQPVAPTVSDRKLRVLLIDDDLVVLRTARKVLATQHDVEATTDPVQALELAASGGFDVVVCDLMMQPMTGMELYAALCQRAPATAARMVFMTGGAYTPDAREFFELVPDRFITKPFRPAQLLALVDSIRPD
ncbi:MAG TPA: ATP-binding protein [Kofleriaceae bacterium]|nr:ATP-binding protein [Kofleriaceae bacterium]